MATNEGLACTVGLVVNTAGKAEPGNEQGQKKRNYERRHHGATDGKKQGGATDARLTAATARLLLPLVPSGQFVARLSDLARVVYDIWDKNNESSGINWLSLEPRRCSWRNSLRNLNGDQVIKTRPSRFEHCSRISEKERSDGE